jgi:hypothetical protein
MDYARVFSSSPAPSSSSAASHSPAAALTFCGIAKMQLSVVDPKLKGLYKNATEVLNNFCGLFMGSDRS